MHGRRCTALLFLFLAALPGCGDDRPSAADPAAGPASGAQTAAPDAGRATAPDAWTVSPSGFGPVRFGMTVEESRRALGGRLAPPAPPTGCGYAPLTEGPRGVAFMIADGRVVRVDVRDPAVATDRGARIGDDEARIRRLYAGRVAVRPHKYTAGHYLVVTPAAPADSLYRIVFETNGSKVTAYRAGALPQVAWVEGCS